MSKVAIIAELTAKPGKFPEYYERMCRHAAASRQEPGCLRFDVVAPREGEERLMLYELYADQAALDFHAGTERFKAHRAATADLVAERKVTICDVKDIGDA